jgi:hypothetical protein
MTAGTPKGREPCDSRRMEGAVTPPVRSTLGLPLPRAAVARVVWPRALPRRCWLRAVVACWMAAPSRDGCTASRAGRSQARRRRIKLECDGCTASRAGRSRARAPPRRVGSVLAAGTGSGLRGDKGELVDLANLHARRVRTVHDLGGWHSPRPSPGQVQTVRPHRAPIGRGPRPGTLQQSQPIA